MKPSLGDMWCRVRAQQPAPKEISHQLKIFQPLLRGTSAAVTDVKLVLLKIVSGSCTLTESGSNKPLLEQPRLADGAAGVVEAMDHHEFCTQLMRERNGTAVSPEIGILHRIAHLMDDEFAVVVDKCEYLGET